MQRMNRALAIVRPTEGFLGWVNSIPSDRTRLSLGALQRDSLVLLVPEYVFEGDIDRLVLSMCTDLMEREFARWSDEQTNWPKDRGPDTFRAFFSVEIYPEVLDVAEEPPLAPK